MESDDVNNNKNVEICIVQCDANEMKRIENITLIYENEIQIESIIEI